jgi:hypothetical protein
MGYIAMESSVKQWTKPGAASHPVAQVQPAVVQVAVVQPVAVQPVVVQPVVVQPVVVQPVVVLARVVVLGIRNRRGPRIPIECVFQLRARAAMALWRREPNAFTTTQNIA